MKRRDFLATLAGAASAALVGCGPKTDRPIAGGFADDGGARGHRLRDRAATPPVRRRERVPVVIVGGGIAGLSAAWWLARSGFRDFVLLEMEDEAGGNSRGGRNDVSAFPWAAHYVPVPDANATLVRTLFAELGVLRADGTWDERHLCFSPQERVFVHGRWHEGLESAVVTRAGIDELHRFRARMAEMRATGQFTIPSARGARPSPLDALPMDAWLRREGFRTPELHWYAAYGTRDDYGALLRDTSAWAGIHYHAARPEHEEGPLTWAEGNAWITARLMERVGPHVRTGMPVHRVSLEGTGARVLAGDAEYVTDAVVWAAPSFLASRLVEGAPPVPFVYSPWLVANLTLDRQPAEGEVGRAWDNVIVDSPALGYVDATHQSLRTHRERTVWTYYRALAEEAPSAGRRRLLSRPWKAWVDEILADLARAHPDLRRCVSRVDIMRMGHAMARPTPGFLSDPARLALQRADGAVVYANADLSGLSLFEEAQQRGVAAAEKVLARVGGRRTVAPDGAG